MKSRLGLATLSSLLLLATLSTCSPPAPLPNPLHCLSRLGFHNRPLGATDYLTIDEYLDVNAGYSSISIYNARDDSTEIHYKKFSSNEAADQMAITFKPHEMWCHQQRTEFMQISELRRVALNLYKAEEIAEKFVDVAIGPSLLLSAIQANMGEFKFSATFRGKSSGAPEVNAYWRYMNSSELAVVLFTSSRGQRRGLEPDDRLSSALLEGARLDVKYLAAYRMLPKRSEAIRQPATSSVNASSNHLDSHTDDYQDTELLFKVHFDIVEHFQTGSLVGRELDELERERQQFSREPFLQPVGIGCWSLGANRAWRSDLIERSRTNGAVSLSATYVTSAGLKGVSYVAYDWSSNMLRLDREGRKSIYDISQGKSYHVGKFSDSSGLEDNLLANELASERCIVLDSVGSIRQDKSVMVQLMGLGSTDAHYLGPRTIEHEQFEVYEISFNDPQDMPLMLQAKLQKVKLDFDLTYFLDYYVQADHGLRFIELYSFERPLKERKLINRLEFVEFSWSLGVAPLDDAQSGTNSDSDLRIFQMDVCYHNRATQSSLVVALENDKTEVTPEQLHQGLHYHKQELTGAIQRLLATSLHVSLVNLVDLKVNLDSVARDGRMLVSGRVVDLKTGVSQLNSLGATYIIEDGHTLDTFSNRFSLEDCILDLLEYQKANRFAFCPHLARCMILSPDYRNSELLAEKLDSSRDMCHLYLLKYSTTETGAGRASYSAEISQRYLDDRSFEFKVGAYDLHDTEQQPFTFKAKLRLKDLVRLDPIGAQLLTGDANEGRKKLELLSGLRYTTMLEDKSSLNMNVRVAQSSELMRAKDETALFAHCRLSCQMDEFCGSFSVCFRGKSDNTNNNNNQPSSECILSTLRLTGERVEQFLEAAGQVREGGSGFQVNITVGEFASQVFVLRRDDKCSLHPRDFVSDYLMIRSVENVHERANWGELEQIRALPEMTFAQCAGLSFEKTLGVEFLGQTNFTYCQLDSLCLVRGDTDLERQLDLADGPCRTYQRDAIKFYTDLRATHMRVADIRATHSSDETLVGELTGAGLDRGPRGGAQSARLVTTFWGVSEADCARDCSLHKTECLAFDSCRNEGKILCILHALRSPLSPRGAYFPLLEREQKLPNDTVTLFGSRICDHFYLKPVYFKVRLQNLLARNAPGNVAEFFPDELRSLEDKIEASSERLNREDLLAVSDLGTIVENYEHGKPQARGPETKPVALVRVFELSIGLIVGCLLVAYKQQVNEVISSAYARVTARV